MDGYTALWSVGSFIAGFIVRTFIPTSKERFDIHASRTENSRKLKAERDERYNKYVKAIREMIAVKNSGNTDTIRNVYWNLRCEGDLYFETFETICAYIRRGDIDNDSAMNDHMEEIGKIAFKSLPEHYKILQEVVRKHQFNLSDKLTDTTFRNIRLFLKGHMPSDKYQELLGLWGVEDPLDHS